MNRRPFLLCMLMLACPLLIAATPDSSNTTKLNPSQVVPYFPTQLIDTSQGEFATMQGCPGDPYRVYAGTPGNNWPVAPGCPNINGTYSDAAKLIRYGTTTPSNPPPQLAVYDPISGNLIGPTGPTDVYCPVQCTVTQKVNFDGTGHITGVIRAICPDGYLATSASHNIQPEVVYNTVETSLPFPVPDLATYNHYVNDLKYSCGLDSSTASTSSVCIPSQYTPSSAIYTFAALLSTPTVGTGGSGSGVGQYTWSKSNCAELSTNCTGGTGNCINLINCTSGAVGNQTTTFCSQSPSHDIAFSVNYNYTFTYYRCTIPVGYVYSTNVAPTSTVCTLNQKVWEKGT